MSEIQDDEKRLREAWNQQATPVVLRRGGKGERIRARLPDKASNEKWLLNGRKNKKNGLTWLERERCWEFPKAWFNEFVERAVKHYGKLYVIQPFRELEVCAPACWHAEGHECQCSCMGANHGSGDDGGWFVASDTFAAKWGPRILACRTMTRN